ncbi:MAG: DUF2207 domain-containing protein, partial [Propionibacteriaceae bacterium]|nr:DUF2207 domain-containing protein [Propionibacteriaceae bacterium]
MTAYLHGSTLRPPAALWTKAVRLWVTLAFATVLAVGFSFAAPNRAFAAGDQIDSFDITYEMQTSGVLKVQETIKYRFGDSSGRHGIERYWITRELYDENQDAVYSIDNIVVKSPDGVATQFSRRTDKAKDGREEQLRIRIGDPDETISRPTATYVISYDVTGAMRTFGDYDELYWDATGLEWKASIKAVNISATVPGGAQELTCTYGAAQSKTICGKKIVSGTAEFSQTNLGPGEGVTIGVKIKSGLVADNKPHLVPDGSQLTTQEKVGIGALAGLVLVSAIGAPIVGVLWWRKNGRDQRYAGLAPGTVPVAGQSAEVVFNDPDIPIPVAFSPPKIPVAEAGLLIDGQV